MKVKENRRNFSLQYRKYGKKEDTRDEKQEELLLVSHCILNVRSKIQYAVEFETEEERNRKAF